MPLMTGSARKRMALWVWQARPARRITYLPSKLNTSPLALVPTNALTVRTVRRMPPLLYETDEHATVVSDVHEAVLHSSDSSSDAEGVGSFQAKLCPSRVVTYAPPVCAAFAGLLLVTAGAAHSSNRSWCCTSHGAQPRKRPYRRS